MLTTRCAGPTNTCSSPLVLLSSDHIGALPDNDHIDAVPHDTDPRLENWRSAYLGRSRVPQDLAVDSRLMRNGWIAGATAAYGDPARPSGLRLRFVDLQINACCLPGITEHRAA